MTIENAFFKTELASGIKTVGQTDIAISTLFNYSL